MDGRPGVLGVSVLRLVDTDLNTVNGTVIIQALGTEENNALEKIQEHEAVWSNHVQVCSIYLYFDFKFNTDNLTSDNKTNGDEM